MRYFKLVHDFIKSEYLKAVEEFDFEIYPKGLIVNGGMGLGKTYTSIKYVKDILNKRYGFEHRALYLTSRTAAMVQFKNQYKAELRVKRDISHQFTFSEWLNPDFKAYTPIVMNYHSFMSEMNSGRYDKNSFDLIFADESQSLAIDDFANPMGAFFIWVTQVFEGKVIWLTANGKFVRQFFSKFKVSNNYRFVLDDEYDYFTSCYNIGKIYYHKTSSAEKVILPALKKVSDEYRMLVFLRSAKRCYNFYNICKDRGIRAAFCVADHCQTKIEIDGREQYLTILFDDLNRENGWDLKNSLFYQGMFPANVDVLFTTSALRESISINDGSFVKIIITDNYVEEEIFQQRGRVRDHLDEFHIVPQRQGTKNNLDNELKNYEELEGLTEIELAENYDKNKPYVVKIKKKKNGEEFFCINYPALYSLNHKLREYKYAKSPRRYKRYIEFKYTCLSSGKKVTIVDDGDDGDEYIQEELLRIALKYAGLPLIDKNEEDIIRECMAFLRKSNGSKRFGLSLVLKKLRELRVEDYTIEILAYRVGKKHIQEFRWPENYLGKHINVISVKEDLQ